MATATQLVVEFSSEMVVARRHWNGIFKVLKLKKKIKNYHLRIYYPIKISLKSEGEINTFSGK